MGVDVADVVVLRTSEAMLDKVSMALVMENPEPAPDDAVEAALLLLWLGG
jgi:hypothetical protein